MLSFKISSETNLKEVVTFSKIYSTYFKSNIPMQGFCKPFHKAKCSIIFQKQQER